MVPNPLESVFSQLDFIEMGASMIDGLLHLEHSVLVAAEAAPFAFAILLIEVASLGDLVNCAGGH